MNSPENYEKGEKGKDTEGREKCTRTYACEIFSCTCDVAEQEGSIRSESRSGATLSCGMSSGKRGGAGAAGMLTQAPGPLWSCTHMQWHGADSQSSALLRLTDEQWQHEVSLPLGGFRQKGCFDSVWKCTAAVFHVFASVCLCVQGVVDECVWFTLCQRTCQLKDRRRLCLMAACLDLLMWDLECVWAAESEGHG